MYGFLDQPVASLNRGGQFLIWSIRSWSKASSGKLCVGHTLAPAFAKFGMIASMAQFHTGMTHLTRDGLESLHFEPLCARTVSEDEAMLLSIFATLSGLDVGRVRRTLESLVTEDSVAPLLASLSFVTKRLREADLIPNCPIARRVKSQI